MLHLCWSLLLRHRKGAIGPKLWHIILCSLCLCGSCSCNAPSASMTKISVEVLQSNVVSQSIKLLKLQYRRILWTVGKDGGRSCWIIDFLCTSCLWGSCSCNAPSVLKSPTTTPERDNWSPNWGITFYVLRVYAVHAVVMPHLRRWPKSVLKSSNQMPSHKVSNCWNSNIDEFNELLERTG